MNNKVGLTKKNVLFLLASFCLTLLNIHLTCLSFQVEQFAVIFIIFGLLIPCTPFSPDYHNNDAYLAINWPRQPTTNHLQRIGTATYKHFSQGREWALRALVDDFLKSPEEIVPVITGYTPNTTRKPKFHPALPVKHESKHQFQFKLKQQHDRVPQHYGNQSQSQPYHWQRKEQDLSNTRLKSSLHPVREKAFLQNQSSLMEYPTNYRKGKLSSIFAKHRICIFT